MYSQPLEKQVHEAENIFFFFLAVTFKGAKFSPGSQQGLISSSAPLKTPLCEVWCNMKSEIRVSVPPETSHFVTGTIMLEGYRR